ncbi:subtilisin family serine protease [Actinokineospora baliensis]|uniref:putative Ig domain-containing protein n=1 Tax=Actinokineospora baliensis TaxID=547056 RepID=UPI00195C641D|nr:putative Ig domain-containing protein [Actinokineospora baliensis]MBM7772216.1 subtilisin family serine protease [Actinokineospora baliensis]
MREVRASLRRRALAAGVVAATATALVVGMGSAEAAEGVVLGADRADAIPGSYLVTFKDTAALTSTVDRVAADVATRYGASVRTTWRYALRGFAAGMTAAQARKLAADPAVASVEQDAVVRATGTQPNPPSWGLDRIDQRNLPLNQNYNYDSTGAGVTAYIIDTGIRISHRTFGTRATWGTNTVDTNNTDCHGHGTHVAGTVGGTEYGVAKDVKLVAVKVLNCAGSGSNTGVVSGVDWVTRNAVKPAVANMSLGGGAASTVDTAVRNSVNAGITYAVASGNDNTNACNSSPARVTEAITVNATAESDARASFSNYGTCTDIFAPGQNITSAWKDNDTSTNRISGTSMATPHVAGAVARYLQGRPGDTPAQVATALMNQATPSKVTNPGTGSPNRLLFTGEGTGTPTTVTPPGNQSGTVGTPASLTLSATGGTAPYTWTATGLPAGLSISTGGVISGTPTTAGNYNVTVTATPASGTPGSASFSWAITAPPAGDAEVISPGDQNTRVGTPVNLTLQATGATAPYRWSAVGLPTGLSLSTGGVITGTPTTADIYGVTVTATPASGNPGSTKFNWTVTDAPGGDITIADPGPQSSKVGDKAGLKLVATGGTGPYTWSVTGLPDGLSAVDAAGTDTQVIRGTPSKAGQFRVTVTATGTTGGSGTVSFDWTVTGGVTITITDPGAQKPKVGEKVTVALSASGGTAPYRWSARGLPSGLSIDGSGLITGTPTEEGQFLSVVFAAASDGTGNVSIEWNVGPGGGGCGSAPQLVTNPDFEGGSTGWTSTTGVIGNHGSWGVPAHSGTTTAWLGGRGTTYSENVGQSITIPTGCSSYTLSFWVWIDTDETEAVEYDTMSVRFGTTTLKSFSNVDAGGDYQKVTVDVSALAGQTANLQFVSTEDASLQTSFVLDDITLAVS